MSVPASRPGNKYRSHRSMSHALASVEMALTVLLTCCLNRWRLAHKSYIKLVMVIDIYLILLRNIMTTSMTLLTVFRYCDDRGIHSPRETSFDAITSASFKCCSCRHCRRRLDIYFHWYDHRWKICQALIEHYHQFMADVLYNTPFIASFAEAETVLTCRYFIWPELCLHWLSISICWLRTEMGRIHI